MAFFIPKRKNLQFGQGSWLVLPNTKKPGSLFERLLALARLRVKVPKDFRGRVPVREYLFRDIQPRTGHTQSHKRQDAWCGGTFPIAKKAYAHYLTRLREALVTFCGLSRSDAMAYGVQSLRSGENTHLFHEGLTQEQRMGIGVWMTPRVEMGYLRELLARKVATLSSIETL